MIGVLNMCILIAVIRAIRWFDSTAQAPIRHIFECNLI